MKRCLVAIAGLMLVLALAFGTPVHQSAAQLGSPEASPEGSPVGSPVASPIGSPVASPIASPEASPDATDTLDIEPIATPTVPAPDYEGMIHDLEATVSAQEGNISALQTQVADLASQIATPVNGDDAVSNDDGLAPADEPTVSADDGVTEDETGQTDELEPAEALQTLTVEIVLRARVDEMVGEDLGDECQGGGRFADLGPDTEPSLLDENDDVLATGSLESSEIIFAGELFRECQLIYTITDVPTLEDYTFVIAGRSQMSLSFEELDEVDWTLQLTFGP